LENNQSQTRYQPKPSNAPLRNYIRIVLSRKWIVLLTCLAAISSTFYFLKIVEPVYEAEVLMMRAESKNEPSMLLSQYIPFGKTSKFESIEGHKEILSSTSSVVRVIEELEKEHNLEFIDEDIEEHFSLSSKEDSPIITLTATANTPKRAQSLTNTIAEVYIQKINEVKRLDLTQGLVFLQNQMDSANKDLTVVEETLNRLREKEQIVFIPQSDSSITQFSGGLLNKLQELEVDLAKTGTEIELAEAQLQYVQNSISEKKNLSSSSLPPQIEQIQSKLVEMQLKLDSMRENFTEKDPKVISVQREVDALKRRLDVELAKIQNNEHSNIYSFSELQELMQQSVSLDVELEGLKQKEALLEQQIVNFKQEHPDLVSEQMELTGLERQARVYEQTYMMLLERYEEMSLLKQMEMSRLQIIDEAKLPEYPIHPKKKILLLLSFVLGSGLGIGVAFFLEYLDDSIKLKEDVEEYLELPVIGAIPEIQPFKVPMGALRRQSLSNPSAQNTSSLKPAQNNPDSHSLSNIESQHNREESNNTDSVVKINPINHRKRKNIVGKQAEQLLSHILLFADKESPVITNYRTLAANIGYANVDTSIKTLLITSSAPDEGKTSTSVNLAISFAQMGKKVLLFDADLRKRKIHRIFQQDSSPGLTDYLSSENNLLEDSSLSETFIRSTEVDSLYIFPSGSYVPNPEMLLSSEKMKRLIEALSEEYDIILFDSPPLLSAADAMTLASETDSTLMVIKSGVTKRPIALQARELLENVNAKILGVVLNNIDYSKQYGSYYYYYHYYRSYYGSDEEEEE